MDQDYVFPTDTKEGYLPLVGFAVGTPGLHLRQGGSVVYPLLQRQEESRQRIHSSRKTPVTILRPAHSFRYLMSLRLVRL